MLASLYKFRSRCYSQLVTTCSTFSPLSLRDGITVIVVTMVRQAFVFIAVEPSLVDSIQRYVAHLV